MFLNDGAVEVEGRHEAGAGRHEEGFMHKERDGKHKLVQKSTDPNLHGGII